MPNPPYDKRSTLPGSAGWYEPDGTFHPFNVDLEPDAEYAARVKDLGARSAIASLGGLIASASSTDQVRAAKSSIDALLYEMQHPKVTLFMSATDLAMPAGVGTFLTPILDVSAYRFVHWMVRNTGGQVLTTLATDYYSVDLAAAAQNSIADALPAGSVRANGRQSSGATEWTSAPVAGFVYFRLEGMSALGTTIRVYVVGVR